MKEKVTINLLDLKLYRRIIEGVSVRFYYDVEKDIKYVNPDDLSKVFGKQNCNELRKDRAKCALMIEFLDHTGTLIIGE